MIKKSAGIRILEYFSSPAETPLLTINIVKSMKTANNRICSHGLAMKERKMAAAWPLLIWVN
jgi:hypothetical protein